MTHALRIPVDVAQRDDLTSDAKILFGYIAPMVRCTLARHIIADRLGLRESRVKSAAAELAAAGLVWREIRPGSTTYLRIVRAET